MIDSGVIWGLDSRARESNSWSLEKLVDSCQLLVPWEFLRHALTQFQREGGDGVALRGAYARLDAEWAGGGKR